MNMPVKTMAVLGALFLGVATSAAEKEWVIKVGRQKQLFVDDYIIDQMNGVSQVLNPVTKYEGNPLVVPDRPWETKPFGDATPKHLGKIFLYGSVIYNEDQNIFKMWYQSYGLSQHCYAVSEDGINWHKPELGLLDFEGSKSNNLINWMAMSVVHSPQDPDPARRYKSMAGRRGTFSADGLRWEVPAESQAIPGDIASDQVIFFCYDELSGRYVAFAKVVRKSGQHPRRSVSVSFSEDFLTWTPVQTILVPDERDDELARQRVAALRDHVEWDDGPEWHIAQFYGHCGFPYEGMYLGLHSVFDISGFGPRLVKRHGRRPSAGGEDGATNIELTSSRDLLHWQRVGERKVFLPCGEIGSWDAGRVFTVNRPLIVDDEIWIYYGGFEMSHGSQYHSESYLRTHSKSGIGLAKLRLDGWVSVDAGDAPGTLTSKPLMFTGKELLINAAVQEGGWVGVEVLDETVWAVSGFGLPDCRRFEGDNVRHKVEWQNGSDLSTLAGTPVRLRFQLQKAKLYSFVFR